MERAGQAEPSTRKEQGGGPASPEKASIRGSGFHMNNQLALSVGESWTRPRESLWAPKAISEAGERQIYGIQSSH